MQVAHYARPRGWSETDRVRLVHADGHTFAVIEVPAATSERLSRALGLLATAAERLAVPVLPLVVVPFMGPTGARLCEESGVFWIDRAGNARIRARGLRIHVEGRPDPAPRRGRPASAFAPRSSRVARLLLSQPERWLSQAALARRTGLGPGFVSRIVGRLERDGLVRRNAERALRASEPRLLLEAWKQDRTATARETLVAAAGLSRGEVLLDRVAASLGALPGRWALAGAAGARLLLDGERWPLIDVWVERLPDPTVLQRSGLVPTRAEANVRFAAPKDEWVLRDTVGVDGVPCAAPLQLYLDLPEREMVTPLGARLRAAVLGGPHA